MRITPPAGVAWTAALWTTQMNQTLYYAATNGRGPADAPVEPPKPVAETTGLPPPGAHQVDIRV